MSRRTPWALRVPVLVLGLAVVAVAGILPATVATADDTAAAWSVSPSDAAGASDGRSRFEIEAAAGEAVEQHVLITNSSTVEREFAVYGADAMNTPSGGYDLAAAAVPAVDVGAWIAVAQPTLTIAALSTAVVPFTVSVPAGASPGDHPGGIVVSPVRTQVTQDGVLVDTRVAVRLSVRVAGEVTPALEVRTLTGSYEVSAVPFAAGAATVAFEVVNTGNVKVVGVPRVRLTGPFGLELADVPVGETREVLPGESFTVTSVLPDVAPAGFATAVVDVEMAAATGPQTEIPLVSSTARTTVLLISWTGVAVVVLGVVLLVLLVRWLVRRRRERRAMWGQMVDEARRELEQAHEDGREPAGSGGPARGPAQGAATALSLLAGLSLLLGSSVAGAPPARAESGVISSAVTGTDDADGSVTLTVPKAATGRPTATTSLPRPSAGGGVSLPAEAGIVDDTGEPGSPVVAAPEVTADAGHGPDLLWRELARFSPGQWSLVGLGGATGLGALALAIRGLLAGRRDGALP